MAERAGLGIILNTAHPTERRLKDLAKVPVDRCSPASGASNCASRPSISSPRRRLSRRQASASTRNPRLTGKSAILSHAEEHDSHARADRSDRSRIVGLPVALALARKFPGERQRDGQTHIIRDRSLRIALA